MKDIETHDKYKHYKKLLATVIKKGKKKNHYNELFKNNINDIKKQLENIQKSDILEIIYFTKYSSFIFKAFDTVDYNILKKTRSLWNRRNMKYVV